MNRPTQIAVSETTLGACIVLPNRDAEARLWDGRLEQRCAGWLYSVMIACLVYVTVTGLQKFLRIRFWWPANRVEWTVFVLGIVTALLIVPLLLFGSFCMALAFFPTRIVIHLDREKLRWRNARGPFCWTTHVECRRIARIGIEPLRVAMNERRAVDERPARIVLADEPTADRKVMVRATCTYRVARELTESLAEQLDRLAGQKVTVADLFDPACMTADVETIPDNQRLRVERTSQSLRVRQLASPTEFFSGLRMAIYLTILPVGVILAERMVPELQLLSHLRNLGIIMGVFYALMFIVCALAMGAKRTLVATPDSLQLRNRQFPSSEIVTIGVERNCSEVCWPNGRLILWQVGERKIPLMAGDFDTMRHVATLLRRELRIQAIPQDDLDPTLSAWHFQDEPHAPRQCTFVVEKTEDGVTFTRTATGWSTSSFLSVLICAMSFAFCLAVFAFAWPTATRILGESAWSVIPLAVLCLLVGFSAINKVVSCAQIVVDRQNVNLTSTTALGTTRRTLRRDNIRFVRTGSLVETSLLIEMNDGKQWNPVSGNAHDVRWLATVLRKTLVVGPGEKTIDAGDRGQT